VPSVYPFRQAGAGVAGSLSLSFAGAGQRLRHWPDVWQIGILGRRAEIWGRDLWRIG